MDEAMAVPFGGQERGMSLRKKASDEQTDHSRQQGFWKVRPWAQGHLAGKWWSQTSFHRHSVSTTERHELCVSVHGASTALSAPGERIVGQDGFSYCSLSSAPTVTPSVSDQLYLAIFLPKRLDYYMASFIHLTVLLLSTSKRGTFSLTRPLILEKSCLRSCE